MINKTINDWPRTRDEKPKPIDLGRQRHPPLTFLLLSTVSFHIKKTTKDNAHFGYWLYLFHVVYYTILYIYIYICMYISVYAYYAYVYIDYICLCFCMESSSKTSFCLSALSGGFLKRPKSGEASAKTASRKMPRSTEGSSETGCYTLKNHYLLVVEPPVWKIWVKLDHFPRGENSVRLRTYYISAMMLYDMMAELKPNHISIVPVTQTTHENY